MDKVEKIIDCLSPAPDKIYRFRKIETRKIRINSVPRLPAIRPNTARPMPNLGLPVSRLFRISRMAMIETIKATGEGSSARQNNHMYPAAIAHPERPTGSSSLIPASSPKARGASRGREGGNGGPTGIGGGPAGAVNPSTACNGCQSGIPSVQAKSVGRNLPEVRPS